ncbi:transcriptional regulator [Streptomyces sp. NPDC088387]|uniref:transcriptional regulator n=1 Tax=Streptomyces sp. NPDC088387 TaxID=3365859 RepID=UPI00382B8774
MAPTETYRHPLAVLRSRAGYTHSEYARLIADTHATLGYGHMAARREKVGRWEAGRVVPERTAQFAIAHVHGVPEEEVLSRSWPDWLHLANGDGLLLELPWTASAVPEAILDAVDGRNPARQEYLLATGSAVGSLLDPWRDAMAESLAKAPAGSPPAHPEYGDPLTGHAPGPDGVPEACVRLRALTTFARNFSAGWLVAALELELGQLARQLITETGACDGTGTRAGASRPDRAYPLALAAEGLTVCGFVTRLQGHHIKAQRYYLAALRCAAAAADTGLAAVVLSLHSGQYLDLAMPDEAAELLGAVETLLRRHPGPVAPALVALQQAQLSRVHALRGDDLGRKRALVTGRRALTATSANAPATPPVDREGWLGLVEGVSELDMDRPESALRRFAPVLEERSLGLPPYVCALYLLRAAEAQTALGDTAAGAHTVHKVTALLGGTHQMAAAEEVRRAGRTHPYPPEPSQFRAATPGRCRDIRSRPARSGRR